MSDEQYNPGEVKSENSSSVFPAIDFKGQPFSTPLLPSWNAEPCVTEKTKRFNASTGPLKPPIDSWPSLRDQLDIEELSWENKRKKARFGERAPRRSPSPLPPPLPEPRFGLTIRRRGHRKLRKRLGLPITFEGQSTNVTTVACADTGADSNVISYALARSLALSIRMAKDSVREFRLANGKIVKSIGTISSRCDLAPGQSSMVEGLACFFYVFETLAVPLILGMPLLEETETLNKYRDRLVEQTVPVGLSLQVNLVGSPARCLLCNLGGEPTTANADSGSDADFLSAAYARDRGFIVEPSQETIQFADGSTDVTAGRCNLTLAINDFPATTLEFHVCATLAHNVIVGYDSIEELDIFTKHRSSMVSSKDDVKGLEPIRLLETPSNSVVRSTWNKFIGRSSGMKLSTGLSPLPPHELSRNSVMEPKPSFRCDYFGCQSQPFPTQHHLE